MSKTLALPTTVIPTTIALQDGEVCPLPSRSCIIMEYGNGELFLEYSSLEAMLPTFSRIGVLQEGGVVITPRSEESGCSLMMTAHAKSFLHILPLAALKKLLPGGGEALSFTTKAVDSWLKTIDEAIPFQKSTKVRFLSPGDQLTKSKEGYDLIKAAATSPQLWLKGAIQSIRLVGSHRELIQGGGIKVVPLLSHQLYRVVFEGPSLTTHLTEEVLHATHRSWLYSLEKTLLIVLERGALLKTMHYRSMDEVIQSLLHDELREQPPLHEALSVINHSIGREIEIDETLVSFPSHELEDKMRALCMETEFRFRRVNLAKGKKELIPYLLGFWGPHKLAVAALPGKGALPKLFLPKSFQYLSSSKNIASPSFLRDDAYELYPLIAQKKSYIRTLIMQTLIPMRRELFLMVTGIGFSVLLSFYTPLITKYLYDIIIPGQDYGLLGELFTGLIVMNISQTLFSFSSAILLTRIITVFRRNSTGALWDKILMRDTSHIDATTSGVLYWRIRVLEEIPNAMNEQLLQLALTAPISLFYFFFMVYLSWQMAAVVAATLFVSLILLSISVIGEVAVKRKLWPLEEKTEAFLLSAIRGIVQFRTSMAEEPLLERWEEMLLRTLRYRFKAQKWKNIAQLTLGFVGKITMIPLYMVLWWQLESSVSAEGSLSMGSFLAFMSIYGLFSGSFYSGIRQCLPWVNLYTMWERAKSLIDDKHLRRPRRGGYVATYSGHVAVHNLAFTYSRDDRDVLEGISFTLKPGSFNLLVGPSGCGKSTLLRLMLALETVKEGTILYDGKPFTEWNEESLRRQIGVFLSTTVTFQGTLRENILCGRTVREDLFEKAIKLSCVDEVIKKLPMGLETLLTGSENTFSGGERQRIVLARALLMQPSLLILDEVTSALDNTTQDIVLKNLKESGATIFMVTHRLEMIALADHLFKMDRGGFVQEF